MILLGIDPSLNSTGYGVINAQNSRLVYITSGVIKHQKDDNLPLKLLNISNTLKDVILEFKPDFAGMEETFVNNNFQSSLKLGMTRGAILLTLAELNIPTSQISPNLAKKCVTGQGKASKEQVSFMIKQILSNIPQEKVFSSDDETDALGIAIASYSSLPKIKYLQI
jgi:crossover junction endodeoxyribonuclease RuvC